MLTVQTSNAQFVFTDQIEQQFAISRIKAIETGRWVVVAAINGISGVIAPDGSVVDRTERRVQDVVLETVELKTGTTSGPGVGSALRIVSPILAAIGLTWGFAVGRRGDRQGTATDQLRGERPLRRLAGGDDDECDAETSK